MEIIFESKGKILNLTPGKKKKEVTVNHLGLIRQTFSYSNPFSHIIHSGKARAYTGIELALARGTILKPCRVTVYAIYSSIKTTEHTERCATYIPERNSTLQCK